jgi:hypothetical protein
MPAYVFKKAKSRFVQSMSCVTSPRPVATASNSLSVPSP